MSRNKCFFSRFGYYKFYILYPFVTYLLTLPHIEESHPILEDLWPKKSVNITFVSIR
jgi:hypothetical protein